MYIVNITLYTVQLYIDVLACIVEFTFPVSQNIVIVPAVVYTVQCTLFIIQCTLYIVVTMSHGVAIYTV